jgi:hypothetical protein
MIEELPTTIHHKCLDVKLQYIICDCMANEFTKGFLAIVSSVPYTRIQYRLIRILDLGFVTYNYFLPTNKNFSFEASDLRLRPI